MGRPRKPTKLKELEGDKPSRINRSEPLPPPELADPPDFLDVVGLAAWARLAKVLASMGVLTAAEWDALAIYSAAYSRWHQANEAVKDEGLTIPTQFSMKPNPMLAVAANAQREMTRLLSQLGLTPAARASLHVQEKPGEDALLAFLHPQKPE